MFLQMSSQRVSKCNYKKMKTKPLQFLRRHTHRRRRYNNHQITFPDTAVDIQSAVIRLLPSPPNILFLYHSQLSLTAGCYVMNFKPHMRRSVHLNRKITPNNSHQTLYFRLFFHIRHEITYLQTYSCQFHNGHNWINRKSLLDHHLLLTSKCRHNAARPISFACGQTKSWLSRVKLSDN